MRMLWQAGSKNGLLGQSILKDEIKVTGKCKIHH